MTTSTGCQWEKIKENSAPLARGRNVQALEKTVTLSEDERRRLEQVQQHFEQLVSAADEDERQSSVKGDPLVDWLSYIKFHQEAYPSATHDQFLLLERCFRSFLNHPQYANDGRYVRVCCLFADSTQDSVTTFQEIYKLGIGHKSATFWNAWAFVAEKQLDFQLAEKIFDKAIRKGAQPLQFLLLRQKRFQRRLSRHLISLTQSEEDSLYDHHDKARGILGSLGEDAVMRNDRRIVPGGGVSGSHRGRSSSSLSTFTEHHRRTETKNENTSDFAASVAFPIYDDASERPIFLDDSGDGLTVRTDREREQDRWKENRLAAERWHQRGSLSNTSACNNHPNPYQRAVTPTAFFIHVDKECAEEHNREEQQRQRYSQHQRVARDDRAILRDHTETVSECLDQDALHYVRNPPQTGLREERAMKNLGPEEPIDRTMQKGIPKTMWKNRLLHGMDGNEQCFEEARLHLNFYKVKTNTNKNFNNLALHASENESTFMSLEERKSAHDESLEPFQIFVTTKCRASANRLALLSDATSLSSSFLRNATSENPTPRNISTASSTIDEAFAVGAPTSKEEQTINTQVALRELSMMFSSPAFGLNESKTTLGRHRLNDSCSSENPMNVVEGDGVERDSLKSDFQIYEDC